MERGVKMKDNTVIVEIAGRDSVAALLKYIDEVNSRNEKIEFIFTIVHVPSEYDTKMYENIFALGELLKYHAERYQHTVSNLFYIGENGVWFEMQKEIMGDKCVAGVYSPCMMCHAYCHLARMDYADYFGADILTGERYIHNKSTTKINQSKQFIQLMDEYFAKKDIKFIRPLLEVEDDDVVEEIYSNFLKEYEIPRDRYVFAQCYLSGNMVNPDLETLKAYDSQMLELLPKVMDSVFDAHKLDVKIPTGEEEE